MNLKKEKINSSLNLLKIIAIFMIVIFHCVYKGIEFAKLPEYNKFLYYIFFHFGEIGVNIFMIISGYFLINKNQIEKKKIFKLIFEIYLYSFLAIAILFLFNKYTFDIKDIFPINFSYYWYITDYLIIYIFSTYINKLANNINQNEYKKLLILFIVLFSLFPTFLGIFDGNIEGFEYYNRILWLLFLYLLGGYFRLYSSKMSILNYSFKKLFLILILCIGFLVSFIWFSYLSNFYTINLKILPVYFWQPNSLVLLVLSTIIFIIFLKLNIKSNSFINIISKSVFDIYLLHEYPKLVNVLWYIIFPVSKHINSKKLYVYVIFYSFLICILGIVISIIKNYMFKLINHRKGEIYEKNLN